MEDGATRLATPNKAGTPAGKRSPLEAFASSFRNKQFHTSFDELPHNEEVNQNFICSLRGEGLAKQKGRLYLTQNYAAFTSSLFGKTTKHVARWEDITGIEADIGEITITTPDKELTFSTFVNFDEALEAINESWRSSLAGPSTNGITYSYQKGLKRKESNHSTTSDSDDDYMTSTDDEADGEVTYEDLMKSVSSAKESIGHEMNEEKDREKEAEDTVSEGKKTGRHGDEDDDDSSSSSSEEDEEGERVLEELKKKALEEKKALLQTLKKQKEDELLQKRLELAQKLQEKKVKHTTHEEDTKEDQDQKPEIKINDKVWEEVEQTAEKLTQEGEGEREGSTEEKGTTTKEDREKEPEKEPDTPAKPEEPKQSPVVQKQDKPSTTGSQPSKTTTTPTTTTPTAPSPAITTATIPQKVDLMKKPQEVASSGTTLWLLGAAVVVAIGVLAMYKMRAK